MNEQGEAHARSLPTHRLRHRARIAARRPLNRWRLLPSFLVIGAQRSGTTSLHRYLAQHPDTAAPIRKEIRYFSTRYASGMGWYRAHFPLGVGRRQTFESTPDYLFHPLAAARASAALPDARLIAVLRNPIERAYSHYLLNVSLQREHLSFEDALDAESERLADAVRLGGNDPAPGYQWYSYGARGLYAQQLETWLSFYPRERLHVVIAERLYDSPAQVFNEIEEFLGIRKWEPSSFANWSRRTSATRDAMPHGAQMMLADRFTESNLAVAELIGMEPGWR